MAGRRPTPTALKVLRGNPGRRPINKAEPKPAGPVGDAPDDLEPEARAFWDRVVRELPAGVLTAADREGLRIAAMRFGEFLHCAAAVREQGRVLVIRDDKGNVKGVYSNPYVSQASAAAREVRAWLVEFGLTPAARSKVSVPEGTGAGDWRDVLGS